MKKMKFLIFATLFAAVCAGFSSCDKDDEEDDNGQSYAELIVGTWECTANTGGTDLPPVGSEITFTKDGKFVLDGTISDGDEANYSVLTSAEANKKYGDGEDSLPEGTWLFIDYGSDVDGWLIKKMTDKELLLQGEKETNTATFEKVK
jgi:hypothetical protein